MLDFGCGGGELMRPALERGIDAYGCDIQFIEWPDKSELERLQAEGRVRLIIGAGGSRRLLVRLTAFHSTTLHLMC